MKNLRTGFKPFCAATFFSTLLFIYPAKAQDVRVQSTPIVCDERIGTDAVRQRSQILASEDGKNRAFGEVEVHFRKTLRETHCLATWTLNISIDGGPFKSYVADTVEEDVGQGFKWEIVSWSADGERLLATPIEYNGDWDRTLLMIFNIKDSSIWKKNLSDIFIFQQMEAQQCYPLFRPLGFIQNDIAFEVVVAEELDPDRKPCKPHRFWAIAAPADDVRPLSGPSGVEHHGQFMLH